MAKKRKITGGKKNSRPAAEDDLRVWQAVAQTVEPLKNRDLAPDRFGAKAPPPGQTAPLPPAPRTKRRLSTQPGSPARPGPPARPGLGGILPDLSHSHQPGLDNATAKRMRRGQVRVQGRVDLHGMTQVEAHRALDMFLSAAVLAGKRDVLVITGKGIRADGSIGVLREQVPRWLSAHPNRDLVVAFTYAAAKDGGEGALYVRLKKR